MALQLDSKWHQYEQDARKYSLAIRLPECLLAGEIEAAYARIVDEYGFGELELVETLIHNRIAQRFRVTPADANRRTTNYPCDFRDRIRNSVQSRNSTLLPESWTVRAARHQATLFRGV